MKIILTLSLISIIISACGDDESLVAPEPVNPRNSPPVINTIFVPERVHASARITLEAITQDVDGDALTYNWQAAGGLLSSNSKPKVIWTAPIEMGVTTVTLSVKDPTNKVVSKTAEVSVIHSLIVPGQEAAGIRLGTLLSDAAKLYGIPKHHFEPHPDGLEHFDVDHYEWKNDGIIVYLDSSDRIRRIDISAPNTAKTVGCNGIGSSQDKVRDEFGPTPYQGGGGTVTRRTVSEHWDMGIGYISFDFIVNRDANHKSLTHLDPDDIGGATLIVIWKAEE